MSGQQLKNRLAPFNPTCSQAQGIALDLLALHDNDVLFDLGCGDGRFLIAAVNRHRTKGGDRLRCVGIESDPVYVARARAALSDTEAGSENDLNLSKCIDIRLGDVMDEGDPRTTEKNSTSVQEKSLTDLSLLDDATAVFLYLLPDGLRKISPLLEEAMRRRRESGMDMRIVSYMFAIPGWVHSSVDRTTRGGCALYLYRDGSTKGSEYSSK